MTGNGRTPTRILAEPMVRSNGCTKSNSPNSALKFRKLMPRDCSFDKEGFSGWRVDFKYNSELTQVFMSSNQIGGFFNRLEASRKYLFGSLGVLGAANNSIISGVFLMRGDEINLRVVVALELQGYEYKKID